jgi:hypothetical protein
MRAGVMDPDGRALTKRARQLGCLGAVLGSLTGTVWGTIGVLQYLSELEAAREGWEF